jgi:spore germination protein (amino acid permease)
MNSDNITVPGAAMILITSGGILNHVIIIPMLLRAAGRDAWLSVLLAGVVQLAVWIPLILFIMKRSGQLRLDDWLRRRLGAGRLGAALSRAVSGLAALYFLVLCWLTLRDVTGWAKISYLPGTPKIVITAAFALVIAALAGSGLRSIAIANGILLPVVIVLGLFVMSANFPHKDYRLLFPLFEDGHWPVVRGMACTGVGLSEVCWFLFLQHRLKSEIRGLPLFVVGAMLIELTLGSLLGAIAIFGPEESARMRFPSYEQWRLVTFGHFFEHTDFLSIYQWLCGAFIRISLGFYIALDMLGLTGPKPRAGTLFLFAAMLAVAGLLPVSDTAFDHILTRFYIPGGLIFIASFCLLLFVLALTERRKAGGRA